MSYRHIAEIVCGYLLTGAATGMTAEAQSCVFHEAQLDNGLKVLTIEDSRAPVVSVQVWYHVGSKDEDPHRQGFAHMFEHMMFRGTDRIGPQDYFKYLQRYGAQVNGYTKFDVTVYFETLPASQLDLALWLEAERMANLKINADYFSAEREVVKEEYRMGYLNRPYGKLGKTLFEASFKVHPYRWTPLGDMDHLNAATVEELVSFWQTYYVPNNATLVVVGDVRHEDLLARAERYFGKVARRPDPPKVDVIEPPVTEPRRVEMTDRAPSPLLLIAYPAPSARDPHALAMDILTRVLSEGQSSRLYRQLVQERQWAVKTFARFYKMEQAGLFIISTTLRPEVDIDEVEQAVLNAVQSLLAKGIRPEEMAKARNQVLAEYVREGETVQGRARQLGYAAVVLGDANRVHEDLTRARTLTADDVLDVAKRVLNEQSRITVVVRPDEQPPELEEVADKSEDASEEITDLAPPKEMPMGTSPEPVDLPFPSLRQLPNGLHIAVFPDSATPAVTITLNFSVGAKDDPPDQAGVADVMANTLRRGTAKWTGQELAERIDAKAISLSQQVNHDALTLGMWSLSEHVALAAETLAEIVRAPTFPQREVAGYVARAAARAAIDEETPSIIASRAHDQALFGQHFRARPASGTSASLKTITREAVKAYHDRLIKPDVATLIFAGDITAEKAFKIATERFGDWQGTAQPSVAKGPPAPTPTRILLIDRPGAVQSELRIGQRVDLNRTQRDYAAGRLLSQVFGESFSGRLNQALRIKKGLTYGARGYYDVDVDTAALTIRTFTRNDKVVEAIQAALAEVKRLSGSDITESELATARDAIIGGFQMGLETPAQMAKRYWDLMVWGLPETWYTSYLQSIRQVTDPEALHEVARRTIHPEAFTIVVVGDAEKIGADLQAIAPVERIPAVGPDNSIRPYPID